jgi:hypothetical protein
LAYRPVLSSANGINNENPDFLFETLKEQIMKPWMLWLLIPIGLIGLLALGLCKAAAQADRMSRRFQPPKDYKE